MATIDGALNEPRRWREPRIVFVNSMSDLFHEGVPTEFIEQVFAVMDETPRHVFQILTKRPERALELATVLPWPENVWLGTSVESEAYLHRIETLVEVPASVRFLSLEPLLGPLNCLTLDGVDWVIVGGESGPGARPMEADWVRSIKQTCAESSVPFFFKQWGGTNKKAAGRLLDGRTWNELPCVAAAE